MCVNCIKVIKESATEQEESIHDDREDNSSNFKCPQSNIAVLNESAALLVFSPIKVLESLEGLCMGKEKQRSSRKE